jgi:hypothetical protein
MSGKGGMEDGAGIRSVMEPETNWMKVVKKNRRRSGIIKENDLETKYNRGRRGIEEVDVGNEVNLRKM